MRKKDKGGGRRERERERENKKATMQTHNYIQRRRPMSACMGFFICPPLSLTPNSYDGLSPIYLSCALKKRGRRSPCECVSLSIFFSANNNNNVAPRCSKRIINFTYQSEHFRFSASFLLSLISLSLSLSLFTNSKSN